MKPSFDSLKYDRSKNGLFRSNRQRLNSLDEDSMISLSQENEKQVMLNEAPARMVKVLANENLSIISKRIKRIQSEEKILKLGESICNNNLSFKKPQSYGDLSHKSSLILDTDSENKKLLIYSLLTFVGKILCGKNAF